MQSDGKNVEYKKKVRWSKKNDFQLKKNDGEYLLKKNNLSLLTILLAILTHAKLQKQEAASHCIQRMT